MLGRLDRWAHDHPGFALLFYMFIIAELAVIAYLVFNA